MYVIFYMSGLAVAFTAGTWYGAHQSARDFRKWERELKENQDADHG